MFNMKMKMGEQGIQMNLMKTKVEDEELNKEVYINIQEVLSTFWFPSLNIYCRIETILLKY